jgi:hypothetical protein
MYKSGGGIGPIGLVAHDLLMAQLSSRNPQDVVAVKSPVLWISPGSPLPVPPPEPERSSRELRAAWGPGAGRDW